MVDAQQADLERALRRAREKGIRVLASGEEWWESGAHARTWHVSSSADPAGTTGHYTVKLFDSERALRCNCVGSETYGRVCLHRALAHEALAREEAALRDTEQRQRERRAARSEPRVVEVSYEYKRGRKTACDACGVAFVAGEPLVLSGGQVVHRACFGAPDAGAGAEPPSQAPGQHAPLLRDNRGLDIWK